MKKNNRVKILKLDMEDMLYKSYPLMETFIGQEGIYIEDSRFRDNCVHVVMGTSIFVFYKKDVVLNEEIT